MASIRTILVDPDAEARLGIREVEEPVPGPGEALVRVEATSLNRGDLLAVQMAEAGWRPGHDIAGTVVRAAEDGTGPHAGSRVVGLLDSGAWAEQVTAPTDRLAVVPDPVSFPQAATLPTAGLTAHRAVEKRGSLLGRRVLITGSTGGVGMFAHQLATLSGAFVVGTSRQARHESIVRDLGADEVVVGEDLTTARAFGPYDHIVESLGGAGLAQAMGMLSPGGTCVSLGWSASAQVELDLRNFLAVGGGSLYALRMYNELLVRPATTDLELLAHLVADQRLHVSITTEGSWDDTSEIAQGLLDRTFTGKAVLHLGQ